MLMYQLVNHHGYAWKHFVLSGIRYGETVFGLRALMPQIARPGKLRRRPGCLWVPTSLTGFLLPDFFGINHTVAADGSVTDPPAIKRRGAPRSRTDRRPSVRG